MVAGARGAGLTLYLGCLLTFPGIAAEISTQAFAREIERVLPREELYDYHKRLSRGPVHTPRRRAEARPRQGEIALPAEGWKLISNRRGSEMLRIAVRDFQNYLETSMGVRVEIEEADSLGNWKDYSRSIVAGTRQELPGCGEMLKGPKDYAIISGRDRIAVCGYDDRGATHGLYNLEARMSLREGPFLPADANIARHSLYESRIVLSWMGWMEFPDALLSHLAHSGFDGVFASVYANPNGDRTTAETSTDFYARLLFRVRPQDPDRMHDLARRAARFGIDVYAPIIYQYLGTPESESGLRRLTRDIVREFPEIRGYILLTEGFWYKNWGGGRGDEEAVREWIRHWTRAVAIVAEECHRIDPAIKIFPWDYNVANRRQNADLKRYLIRQLPAGTIPLLSWENGKSFTVDGHEGFVGDYSISQAGPAEATEAQIDEARRRGMKIYCNADTFECGGQFQTLPYQPVPYQWHARYKALENYRVNGTLESWSSGYTPNIMSELRAWYCWSGAPPLDELLAAIAARTFGGANTAKVLDAWRRFSEAIRLVPDTGPTAGTSSSVSNPLFLEQPPPRTATFKYSWTDEDKWLGYFGGGINPYWPFTLSRLTFYPDFSNRTNRAEMYARGTSGIRAAGQERVLPSFLKYLRLAAGGMDEGLKAYREAALASPAPKRARALREALVAEQLHRTLLSEHAVLDFEDLRMQLAGERDTGKAGGLLDRMETIVRDEVARTELSLVASRRDSRLGFQFECDYVYTPYSLSEKLELLRETMKAIPAYRQKARTARN